MKDYVTSDDVFFVEDKIKALDYYPTPNELWKELKGRKGRFNRKAELGAIIEYFLHSNMAILDKGKLVWIENPLLSKLLKKRGFVVL